MKLFITALLCSLFVVSCKTDEFFGKGNGAGGKPQSSNNNGNSASQPSQGTGNGNGTLDLNVTNSESKDSTQIFTDFLQAFDSHTYDVIADGEKFNRLDIPDQGLVLAPYSVASSDPIQGVDHILIYYSRVQNSFILNFKIIKSDGTDEQAAFLHDVFSSIYEFYLPEFIEAARGDFLNETTSGITSQNAIGINAYDRAPVTSFYSYSYRKIEITRVLKNESHNAEHDTYLLTSEYNVKVSVRFDLEKNLYFKITVLQNNSHELPTVFMARANIGNLNYRITPPK